MVPYRRDVASGGPSSSPSGRDLIQDEVFPSWLGHACSAVALALGVLVVAVADERRWSVALVVAVALVPYLLRLVVDITSWWWSVLTVGALALLQVGGPAWGWTGSGAAQPAVQVSFLLSIWHVVDIAVYHPPARSRITALAVAATIVGNGATQDWEATPVWLAGLALAYVGGRLVRRFGLTVVQLRQAQERLAGEAVAAERRQIAGEVHDVVAHSLSVTALHLTAARMACERGDTELTRAALADAEALVRASLGDVRRTVRLLRPVDGSPVAPSPPGLDDLEALVESVRAAGIPCRLGIGGPTGAVDDATGLTVLRVVQEALTNAVRHQVAPDAVVTVDVEPTLVRVEVRSTGSRRPSAEPGIGLVGMRERVEAHGGSVRAEPVDGGWVVDASIPLPDPTAPSDESAPLGDPVRT